MTRISTLALVLISASFSLALFGGVPSTSDLKSQALMERGAGLIKMGRLEAAEDDLRRATELNDKSAMAFYYLGTAFMAQRKYAEAEPSFRRALALNKKTPTLGRKQWREAADAIGLCGAFRNAFVKARLWYESAIAKDPAYPAFHYNLACIYARQGDRKSALKELRAALETDAATGNAPMLPDPLLDDDLKGFRGDPGFQALLIMNLGPQPNDGPGSALIRRGAKYLVSGDYTKAVVVEREALIKAKESALAWYYLGGGLEMEGKMAEAAKAYERAAALDLPPNRPLTKAMFRVATTRAGVIYTAGKAYDKAITLLLEATRAAPYHPVAYYHLARAYALYGKKQKAEEALKKAFLLKDNMTALDGVLADPSRDPAFASFSKDKDWKSFLKTLNAKKT